MEEHVRLIILPHLSNELSIHVFGVDFLDYKLTHSSQSPRYKPDPT